MEKKYARARCLDLKPSYNKKSIFFWPDLSLDLSLFSRSDNSPVKTKKAEAKILLPSTMSGKDHLGSTRAFMLTNGFTFDGLATLNSTGVSFFSKRARQKFSNISTKNSHIKIGHEETSSVEKTMPEPSPKKSRRQKLLETIARSDHSAERGFVDLYNAKKALAFTNDYLQYSDIRSRSKSREKSNELYSLPHPKRKTEIVKRHDYLTASHRLTVF